MNTLTDSHAQKSIKKRTARAKKARARLRRQNKLRLHAARTTEYV